MSGFIFVGIYMKILYSLANPAWFTRISSWLLLPLALATFISFAIGLYMSLVLAPADYQQGETVRIMFIHVPSAWLALLCYSTMTLSALGTLIFRHPLADIAQKAAAPLGAGFSAICLITGSIWGKPTWGTLWVWDARMTSTLILLMIYLGIIALWRAIDEPSKAARSVAILTLVGAINIPIIKFSVDWWYTLHQPASLLRTGGSAIHSSILQPLLMMGLAYLLLFITLLMVRMRAELDERKIRRLRLMAAQESK
jgi:heme exporter protein C